MSDLRNLIDRALNPRLHGVDPDHCPACFGSCASFPGEWTEDAEELAAALATALESLLDKIEDGDALAEVIQDVGEYIPGSHADDYTSPSKAAAAVSAYLLGEDAKA